MNSSDAPSTDHEELFAQPQARRWRPEVEAFADLMEAKLRENDHKPGWKGDHPEDLLSRLYEEADEIRRSWDHWRGTAWPRETLAPVIGRECADVANFAMMIADVCGALAPAAEQSRASAETWHQALMRLGEARDYAGMLRLLRAPAPPAAGQGLTEASVDGSSPQQATGADR